tara:strand:- start:188 stop:865 length:678 start_codon:yes stop_codon:yes gene_type:complete
MFLKRILFLIIISPVLTQEQNTVINVWKNIIQTNEMIEYFDGVFKKLGVTIEETGEKFTVYHNGDSIYLEPGIDPDSDFVVPLKIQNINNMVSHSKDGKISAEESWRILSVLFTPITKVTLQSPILSVNWKRKLAGVEDLTHVYLISPDGKEANKHTLIYAKGQWLVLDGLHGKPRRTYQMDQSASLLYQKQIFSAMQRNSFLGWLKFGIWYKKWRKTVSITHNF